MTRSSMMSPNVVLAGAGELRARELVDESVGLPAQDAVALLDGAKPMACARWLLPAPGGPRKRAHPAR